MAKFCKDCRWFRQLVTVGQQGIIDAPPPKCVHVEAKKLDLVLGDGFSCAEMRVGLCGYTGEFWEKRDGL